MRAVVFDQHGQAELLRVAELPVPEPGPHQIRVRVRATGVHPFDAGLRQGGSGFLATSRSRSATSTPVWWTR